MSLTAVVYRNRKHLELGPHEGSAQFVPQTGEVYFHSDELSQRFGHQLVVTKHRLGNLSAIGWLRQVVAQSLEPDSIILRRILYSGSHSGDAIPIESLEALTQELKVLRTASHQPIELVDFISSLEELVRAAEAENNPIVFT